jgi:hypothetical protein
MHFVNVLIQIILGLFILRSLHLLDKDEYQVEKETKGILGLLYLVFWFFSFFIVYSLFNINPTNNSLFRDDKKHAKRVVPS